MLKQFDEIYEVLVESFPVEEYRTYDEQKRLFEKDSYDVLLEYLNGKVVGICAYYDLGDYLYIEHLAFLKSTRGLGLGTKMMNTMIDRAKKQNKHVVLEVEPATDEVTRRRIHFYERLGLSLNSRYHFQPSLRENADGVELKIMSTKPNLEDVEHKNIRQTLNKEVYEVDPEAYL